jgi:hypothetical protein
MSGEQASLAEQLSAYLGNLWNTKVEIEGLARIPGGASRQTYRFDAVMNRPRAWPDPPPRPGGHPDRH